MSVAVQDKFLYMDQVWEVVKVDGDNAEVVQSGDPEPYIVTVPVKKLEELSRIAVNALKEELALSECMVEGAIIGGDEHSIRWAENRVKWLKDLVSSLDLDNKKTAAMVKYKGQEYEAELTGFVPDEYAFYPKGYNERFLLDKDGMVWDETGMKEVGKGKVIKASMKIADRHSASFQVYQNNDEFVVDFEDDRDELVVKSIKEILKNRDYNSANEHQRTYVNIGAAWEDEVKGLEDDLKKHSMEVLVDDKGGLRKMFHVYYDTLTPSNPEI